MIGLAALLALLHASAAHAYCRTTTCDVAQGNCARDAEGCATEGVTLSWPSHCIAVAVVGGSPLRGISVGEVKAATTEALQSWTQAQCSAASGPSLAFEVLPLEHKQAKPLAGASAVRFRDRDWPHHDLQTNVALTTLTINRADGRILDAEVELNSFAQPFFTDGSLSRYDLQLVLLHEMGHVLGLGHSAAAGARMSAAYSEPAPGLRWLTADDEHGVCSMYPPTRSTVCMASFGETALCETLESCRWVALVLLSLCWGVFGVLWRYRFRVYGTSRRNRASHARA